MNGGLYLFRIFYSFKISDLFNIFFVSIAVKVHNEHSRLVNCESLIANLHHEQK